MSRKRSPAIGIDLGTSFSCVAVWGNESNRVEIVNNGQGNPITPSYVAYGDHEPVLVGECAKNQCFRNPTTTVFAVKRIMGATFGDPSLQEDIKNWPFRVVEGPNNKPMVKVEHKGVNRNISPVEIASLILKNLKGSAESHLSMTVTDAVITVPSYFNDKQRQATMEAGIMAGLNVLRLINEPTAAAIAYSLDKYDPKERNIFIFDLGGGTLDLSILGIKDGNITVKAVGGDTHLGGEDLDNAMVDYCVKEFRRQYNEDLSASERALARLKNQCEIAKRSLSSTTKATIDIDCLFGGEDFKIDVTRAKFEELNSRFFKNCLDRVYSCIQHGKMSSKTFDEVVLVGGSSRIPKLQQMLGDVFPGKPFCKSVNADQVVAQGAAVLAAKLTENDSCIGREIVVMDVTPLSLGIRVMNGCMSVVIPRNTPIPTLMERRFLTRYENQTKLTVRVFQGECDEANDNIYLGGFALNDIPPGPIGKGVIVTFSLDANGILEVKAELESTNKKRSMHFVGTGNVLKEDVEKMLKKVKH